MKRLQLGADFDLPDSVITSKLGFVAISGGGKTYAAGKYIEEVTRLGVPAIIIDLVGTWYGLRLSADGKGPGLPIYVVGGDHGDLPLDLSRGEELARLLVRRDASAVIDCSLLRKGEYKRYIAEFCESLFREAKQHRTARVVVFEEAQKLAPQRVGPAEARMLGAVEDIVRLGRNYGIGSVLITQRPQSVSKEVLNQVTTLFVGQLGGSHERKAVESWVVEESGDSAWLDELPKLHREMYLWTPRDGSVRKVKFGAKSTFDASATPEVGKSVRLIGKLAPVDVESLRAALATPSPKASAKAKAEPERTHPAVAELRELRAKNEAFAARIAEQTKFRLQLERMASDFGRLGEALQAIIASIGGQPPAATVGARPAPAPRIARAAAPPAAKITGSANLQSGARKMLAVAATFSGTMTKTQIIRAAGMTPSGGGARNNWSRLKVLGFIESAGGDFFRVTPAGYEELGAEVPDPGKTFPERLAFWNARLKQGQQEILQAVLDAGRPVTPEELGRLVHREHTGGGFRNYVSALVTNRLLERADGCLQPHPWLITGKA
jgi:uncharacterized protein